MLLLPRAKLLATLNVVVPSLEYPPITIIPFHAPRHDPLDAVYGEVRSFREKFYGITRKNPWRDNTPLEAGQKGGREEEDREMNIEHKPSSSYRNQ